MCNIARDSGTPSHPPLNVLLKSLPSDRLCIVGIGNRMKGDDAAGVRLIDFITGHVQVECIDAGVAPENYLEKIVGLAPSTVLLVDATTFDGTPGEIRIFTPEEISPGGLSTHALSLQMVSDYLKARVDVQVLLIGIQPETTRTSDGDLSPSVEHAVEDLARMMQDAFGGQTIL
jgi:hydrogenase maturation protease HycI